MLAFLDLADSPATRATGWWLIGVATGAALYVVRRLYQSEV